jgi:hypothetical protein
MDHALRQKGGSINGDACRSGVAMKRPMSALFGSTTIPSGVGTAIRRAGAIFKLNYWRAFRGKFCSNAAWIVVFGICMGSTTGRAADPIPAAPAAFVNGNKPSDAGLPISTVTQPLPGPLFFTPDQRARIDAARKRGVVVIEEEIPDVAPVAPVMNGFLQRSDGQAIAWVNGRTHLISNVKSSELLVASMIGLPPTAALKPSIVPEATPAPKPVVKPAAKPRPKPRATARSKPPAKRNLP